MKFKKPINKLKTTKFVLLIKYLWFLLSSFVDKTFKKSKSTSTSVSNWSRSDNRHQNSVKISVHKTRAKRTFLQFFPFPFRRWCNVFKSFSERGKDSICDLKSKKAEKILEIRYIRKTTHWKFSAKMKSRTERLRTNAFWDETEVKKQFAGSRVQITSNLTNQGK